MSLLQNLRIILFHKSGICSVRELKTIRGRNAAHTRKATLNMSLIESDEEFDKSMGDTGEFATCSAT
ncbi:Hypothetical predicted protein [Octopus vulgaris]|uniref:Uncharacterized protein n=1 Tax=Octopus vulgaris TaxID=6645 RepID=A0AA36EYZ5_OCTVU|nr:Hypothetical predicted protein [Octopus vulgaris]